MSKLRESLGALTVNNIVVLVLGCIMVSAGLGLYIYGTIASITGVIQASYWLTSSGSLILGIQINTPSK